MTLRYFRLFDGQYNKTLYDEVLNEQDRIIITRWRLSCYPLFIEVGRHKIPKIREEERKCCICNIIEDESHSIFHCIVHRKIRLHFQTVITKYPTVKEILNPRESKDIGNIAKLLRMIENNMFDLKMNH